MVKITINHIALCAAITLSIIAGYFSVLGLAIIFAGAYVSVLVMGGVLETAKVVTVAWLTRNWTNSPKPIKYYLSLAVVVLMLITSMGTFGYLSKAHLETTNQVSISQLRTEPLQVQLSLEQQKLDNAQAALSGLETIVTEANPRDANYIRVRQRSEREALQEDIGEATDNISKIQSELLPLRAATQELEAELGPLKYVAEMVYGEQADNYFDSAVRIVILLIVVVFDPLAIALLIAANYGFKPQNRLRFNKQTGKLETLY